MHGFWRFSKAEPGVTLGVFLLSRLALTPTPLPCTASALSHPLYLRVCGCGYHLDLYLTFLPHKTTDSKLQNSVLLTKHFEMTPRTAGILLDDYDVITRIRKSDTSARYLLIDRLYSNVTLGPFSHSMKGDMAELERALASLGFNRLPPTAALYPVLLSGPGYGAMGFI